MSNDAGRASLEKGKGGRYGEVVFSYDELQGPFVNMGWLWRVVPEQVPGWH